MPATTNEENGDSKRLYTIVGVAAIMLALALGSIIGYAYLSRQNQNRNCAAALRVRDAVVVLLQDADNTVSKTKPNTRITQKDIDDARAFYGRNIRKLRAVRCAKD